jgi:hypothetical protein
MTSMPGLERRQAAEWAAAILQAGQLQAAYPGWTIRPVHRRDGPGLEAIRDQAGLCSLTGTAAEVRAALVAMTA